MIFDFIAPLTIGLVGSFHCIGMCGPIAVALPLKNHSAGAKIAGGLLYNIGRTLTYAVLGLLFGLLGAGIHLAGFQQWTSILLGAIMILSVLFPYFFKQRINLGTLFTGYAGRLISNLRKQFSNHSYQSLFSIDFIWFGNHSNDVADIAIRKHDQHTVTSRNAQSGSLLHSPVGNLVYFARIVAWHTLHQPKIRKINPHRTGNGR